MTEDWRACTLGDVIELKRGYDLPTSDRRCGSVPIVSSSGISGWHDEAKVRAPGVVTGRYGTIGQVFFVDEDFWPLNTTLYVRDFKGHDERFISYFLGSLDFQAFNDKSSVPGVNRNDLHRYEVIVPEDTAEQRAIANVLGALDDKIEQNRRTARALERLARAIFRAWFVDFEPVKAKAEGAASFPSMPREVFDALPTRFVDSDIGAVPEGWEVKAFGDLLVLQYGKALKADNRRPGSIPVYGSNGRVGWHDEVIAHGPGIVVGGKGNPGTINWSQGSFFAIDTTFFVQLENARASLPLLFHQLEAADLSRLAADSAVPGVNRNMIYAERCVVPHEAILTAFDRLVLNLRELRAALMQESGKLAAMRDYLLPKLLSGDVRVTTSRGEESEPA